MNSPVSSPLPSHGVKVYKLVRTDDESGVSGTGHIAEVAVFSSGACILSWLTRPTSIGVYESLDEMVAIHGHAGKTRVEILGSLEDVAELFHVNEDSANNMYAATMAMDDAWFGDLDRSEVVSLLIARKFGIDAADEAREEFDRAHAKRSLPEFK